MDLSTQPLFQSPAADRLLFARDLRADRATLVSGHWNSFPISASFARNRRRFSGRRGLATNEQDGSAYSDLGARPLRPQPGFPHGFRLSRKYRSGDGVAAGLRRLDVSPESTGTRGIIFCPKLSDQNRAAASFAGVCFLLVVATENPRLLNFRRNRDLYFVVGAAAAFPTVVREERPRL